MVFPMCVKQLYGFKMNRQLRFLTIPVTIVFTGHMITDGKLKTVMIQLCQLVKSSVKVIYEEARFISF